MRMREIEERAERKKERMKERKKRLRRPRPIERERERERSFIPSTLTGNEPKNPKGEKKLVLSTFWMGGNWLFGQNERTWATFNRFFGYMLYNCLRFFASFSTSNEDRERDLEKCNNLVRRPTKIIWHSSLQFVCVCVHLCEYLNMYLR